jgi:type VI protein secretion system component Hcp
MSIYLTLDGKKVSSEKDIKDFVQKTVANAIQKRVTERLSHLSTQMRNENVKVEIDAKTGVVSIKNGSEELREKMSNAMNRP